MAQLLDVLYVCEFYMWKFLNPFYLRVIPEFRVVFVQRQMALSVIVAPEVT
jgi:hypothetical protein